MAVSFSRGVAEHGESGTGSEWHSGSVAFSTPITSRIATAISWRFGIPNGLGPEEDCNRRALIDVEENLDSRATP